jgi:hypothetical protein
MHDGHPADSMGRPVVTLRGYDASLPAYRKHRLPSPLYPLMEPGRVPFSLSPRCVSRQEQSPAIPFGRVEACLPGTERVVDLPRALL